MKPQQRMAKIQVSTPQIQSHQQQIRQLIIKINQLQQENHRLHERIEELTNKNAQLIAELTNKNLIIKRLSNT